MKKKILIPISAAFLVGGTFGASADSIAKRIQAHLDYGMKMTINGQEWSPKDETNGKEYGTIIYEGRTYIPLRPLAEKMGLDVNYDGKNKTIQMKKEAKQEIVDENKGNAENKPEENGQSENESGEDAGDIIFERIPATAVRYNIDNIGYSNGLIDSKDFNTYFSKEEAPFREGFYITNHEWYILNKDHSSAVHLYPYKEYGKLSFQIAQANDVQDVKVQVLGDEGKVLKEFLVKAETKVTDPIEVPIKNEEHVIIRATVEGKTPIKLFTIGDVHYKKYPTDTYKVPEEKIKWGQKVEKDSAGNVIGVSRLFGPSYGAIDADIVGVKGMGYSNGGKAGTSYRMVYETSRKLNQSNPLSLQMSPKKEYNHLFFKVTNDSEQTIKIKVVGDNNKVLKEIPISPTKESEQYEVSIAGQESVSLVAVSNSAESVKTFCFGDVYFKR